MSDGPSVHEVVVDHCQCRHFVERKADRREDGHRRPGSGLPYGLLYWAVLICGEGGSYNTYITCG